MKNYAKCAFRAVIIITVLLISILISPVYAGNIEQKQFAVNKSSVGKRVPILTYHCINDNIYGDWTIFIPPEIFAKQMKYLHDNGYTPITFRDLNKLNSIKKPVMITFDDGYKDNYTYAYPILKKYGFKSTIFLVSKAVNHDLYLNRDEINEMKGLVDFEAHTATHCELTKIDAKQLEYELGQSKKELQSLLNREVFVLSYPYGFYNENVIKAAKKFYRYAVTVKYGAFFAGKDNNYEIHRINISPDMNLGQFISVLHERPNRIKSMI